MPSIYKIVKTKKQVRKLIEYCKQTGYASIDFETSGHDFHSELGYPTILGVSFQPGSAWVIPLGHFDSPFKNYEDILKLFGEEVIENKAITKIAWNLKFEYKWFKKYGIQMTGRCMDAMLAKYLLDEERPNDLKSMVNRYLPEFAGYEDEYEGSKLPWDEKPLQGLSQYCALDCDLTFRLMLFFENKLMDHKLYKLFRNMMMMGTRVLGDSEFNGIKIDKPYLEKTIKSYDERLAQLDIDLKGDKTVRKFQNFYTNDKINDYINGIQKEIDNIEVDINQSDDPKVKARKQKQIQSREEKISRVIAKDFTTNKERDLDKPVNFASPAQMIDLLFKHPKGFRYDIIKYTVDKKNKRETDRPSTDEEVLSILAKKGSTFAENLIKIRGLQKLYSTYMVGIMEKMSNEDQIHASFLLHGTVTGRLSSRNPNLQNIPRDTTAADIKPMFIPPKGYLLLQLDYSQAELRVLAAAAGETEMIRWFKIGRDIHLASACKAQGWDYDERIAILDDEDHPLFKETKIARKRAKTINFGIVYGQGAKKLAVTLECSESEAEKFLKDFDRNFPQIAKYIKKQHKLVKRQAFVRNVFGRKRRLPKIDSPEWFEKAEAQRQSVNAPIQGAASDYTLFSSIIIYEQILKGLIPGSIKQVYTVHDSLGYIIKPRDIHKTVPLLEAICRNPETKEWFGFQIDDVVMQVDFEIGKDWGHLRKYSKDINYKEYYLN